MQILPQEILQGLSELKTRSESTNIRGAGLYLLDIISEIRKSVKGTFRPPVIPATLLFNESDGEYFPEMPKVSLSDYKGIMMNSEASTIRSYWRMIPHSNHYMLNRAQCRRPSSPILSTMFLSKVFEAYELPHLVQAKIEELLEIGALTTSDLGGRTIQDIASLPESYGLMCLQVAN